MRDEGHAGRWREETQERDKNLGFKCQKGKVGKKNTSLLGKKE